MKKSKLHITILNMYERLIYLDPDKEGVDLEETNLACLELEDRDGVIQNRETV